MFSLCKFGLFLSLYGYSSGQDAPFFIYCSSENCTETNGMPCERIPPCAPTGDCREMPMSEALRFTITHFHNQVRSTTATTTPGASKMRALKYNIDLETVAQCWINTCTVEKSVCLITPLYNAFGQNLGAIDIFDRPEIDPRNDPASLWQEMMTTWIDEVNNINAEIIQKLPSPEETYRYEHYTQIVTDYTTHIGCAWSSSNETIHFACFYGPPGGIKDHPVYEFGPYCSKCPERTECYKPLGLCAQIETGVQHWKMKMRGLDHISRGVGMSSTTRKVMILFLAFLVLYDFVVIGFEINIRVIQ